MSQIETAKRQISRYGFKGAAILTTVSTVEDAANLSVVETDDAPINLLSYVGRFPTSRIDGKTIFSTDRRTLAVPDDDWDGIIPVNSKITIDSLLYSIVSINTMRVKQVIAYVEIQCRG